MCAPVWGIIFILYRQYASIGAVAFVVHGLSPIASCASTESTYTRGNPSTLNIHQSYPSGKDKTPSLDPRIQKTFVSLESNLTSSGLISKQTDSSS